MLSFHPGSSIQQSCPGSAAETARTKTKSWTTSQGDSCHAESCLKLIEAKLILQVEDLNRSRLLLFMGSCQTWRSNTAGHLFLLHSDFLSFHFVSLVQVTWYDVLLFHISSHSCKYVDNRIEEAFWVKRWIWVCMVATGQTICLLSRKIKQCKKASKKKKEMTQNLLRARHEEIGSSSFAKGSLQEFVIICLILFCEFLCFLSYIVPSSKFIKLCLANQIKRAAHVPVWPKPELVKGHLIG